MCVSNATATPPPFNTLPRVETAETRGVAARDLRPGSLSIPYHGSRLLRPWVLFGRVAPGVLSIPYHGSRLLRPAARRALRSGGRGLSIPYHGSRLLRRAAGTYTVTASATLSIPYHGSRLLRRREDRAGTHPKHAFNTLPRVETAETRDGAALHPPRSRLSIPYHGSRLLRPGCSVSGQSRSRSFNTLPRVETAETVG